MSAAPRKVLFDNWPYMRGWEETHGGDRFTYIETGPALSVIPIHRDSTGVPVLTLINEHRHETDSEMLKAPGGYLRDRQQVTAALEILREEAGLVCQRLHLLVEKMEGFTVIELPISIYLALGCASVAPVASALVPIPLEDAVERVLRHEILDQSNADAIMRIALLEARGRLPL